MNKLSGEVTLKSEAVVCRARLNPESSHGTSSPIGKPTSKHELPSYLNSCNLGPTNKRHKLTMTQSHCLSWLSTLSVLSQLPQTDRELLPRSKWHVSWIREYTLKENKTLCTCVLQNKYQINKQVDPQCEEPADAAIKNELQLSYTLLQHECLSYNNQSYYIMYIFTHTQVGAESTCSCSAVKDVRALLAGLGWQSWSEGSAPSRVSPVPEDKIIKTDKK